MISSAQKGRVQSFVERYQAEAHLHHRRRKSPGGKGFFFEPTVVAGAHQDDEIVRKEVFGPVVSVTQFDDVDQAVAWANDRLRPRLFRGPRTSARARCCARLHYGCTWVNTISCW